MYIDGKKFTTYKLDTENSIRDRIAYQHNTLPNYVVLEKEKKDKFNSYILIELFNNFKPYELDKFHKEYKSMFNVDIFTLGRLWYLFVMKEGDKSVTDPFVEFKVDEYLKKQDSSLQRVTNGIDIFKEDYNKKVKDFSNKIKEEIDIFKQFEKYEETYSTNVELIKVKSEVIFEVDYDVYELFNNLKMSRDIPFATIGEYYKILKDFNPLDKWTYAQEKLEGDFGDKKDVLYLKVLNVRNEPIKNFTKTDNNIYSTVSIFFETSLEEKKRLEEEEREKERKEKEELEKKERERKREERKKKKLLQESSESDLKSSEPTIKRKKKVSSLPLIEEKKIEELKIDEQVSKEVDIVIEEDEKEIEEEETVIVKHSKVYMRIESSINPDFTEDELIERILSTFPRSTRRSLIDIGTTRSTLEDKILILSKQQVQIKAEFFVPQFYTDRYIFLDLVLNDPLFSRMCFVHERPDIQKERGGVYVYFNFHPEDTEDKMITFSITEQVVEKTSLTIISKNPDLFQVNVPYLKIRISKVSDMSTANRFRDILNILLTAYKDKMDDVVEKYSEYIDDFSDILQDMRDDIEKKRRKSTRKKEMLKDIDPDQFISGYSRWLCSSKRAPKIIATKENQEEPSEIAELEENNVQVMLFPKDGESSNGRTQDSQNQYYYSCDHHEEYKYPGLRVNKLSNSEKYPIVPCCYKKDHRSKRKSIWRMYYEEGKTLDDFREQKEKTEDEIEDEIHVYMTNKVLPPKRLGILPKNIENYFASIDINNKYLRQGVSRSNNSVIETLLYAFNPEFMDMNTEDRTEQVIEVREKMIKMAKNSDIYQNVYSYTPETIRFYLEDTKKFFDPKMFIRLLEEYFNCYIFIFSQNDEHPHGILDSPLHTKEYLQMKKDISKPTLFIYQHTGSELDKIEDFPQCEAIIQIDNNDEKEVVFNSRYEIVKRTEEVFRKMYTPIFEIDNISSIFKHKIIGQKLDYYGKTRFIQFKDICVLTEPLPPLSVSQECKFKTVSEETALNFLKEENITDYKYHIITNKKVGILVKHKTFQFYIPIRQEETKLGNEVDVTTPSFILPKSELLLYNEYHRLARYLTEYLLYTFSLFYKEKNKNIDQEFIVSFVKKRIEIDPNFVYKPIQRTFSINGGVMRRGKLVLHNETILKKLLYCLRLRLRNNEEEVKNYSEYKYIQQYYADVRDFEQTESQPILYGQDALMKWINSKKIIYPLVDAVQHTDDSLLKELSKMDTNKPFVLVFYANWNKNSKMLLSRIYTTKRRKGKEFKTFFKTYSDRINFVYIDIDKNKSVTTAYNVSSIPFIITMKVENNKLVEYKKIKGGDNMNENAKLLEKGITELLNIV